MSARGDIKMTPAAIRAHAEKNKLPMPAELIEQFTGSKLHPFQKAIIAGLDAPLHPKRKLRKLREPNQTEAEFGHWLGGQHRAGEIDHYGFEEVTLRFDGMEYTPDYFVIRRRCTVQYAGLDKELVSPENPPRYLIEAVYIEIKGGWKWEDSVIKWKAARGRFKWAQFQFWQKVGPEWQRLG